MSQHLDPIDTIAAKVFEGYVVRKDLVRKFKGTVSSSNLCCRVSLGPLLRVRG